MDPILQQFLLILTALAASQGFWTFVGSRITKTGKVERAAKALLHDRLSYLVHKHISTNHITPEDYGIVNDLFESYRDLGGNGNIARMMEAVRALKIEIKEHAE